MAYASSRVLLIDDKKPVPLETILSPNLMNWTAAGVPVNEASFARLIHFAEDLPKNITDMDNSAFYADTEFVVLHTNLAADVAIWDSPRPIIENVAGDFTLNSGLPVNRSHLLRAACLLQGLFKPHPDLLADHAAAAQQLFRNRSGGYAAIHFRAGGMQAGEKNVVKRTEDNLSALMRSLACARSKATLHNITAPLLLLTDNRHLRSTTQHGLLGADVVTTSFAAIHIDHMKSSAKPSDDNTLKQKARTIYVDLLLLAGAKCLIVPTRSGFSNEAYMWGAQECYVSWLHDCFKVPAAQALKSRLDLPPSW